jgi:hypothetical protein
MHKFCFSTRILFSHVSQTHRTSYVGFKKKLYFLNFTILLAYIQKKKMSWIWTQKLEITYYFKP